ncbi:hypothetical protein LXL04_004303 [Taraxacum kok-saghyz]
MARSQSGPSELAVIVAFLLRCPLHHAFPAMSDIPLDTVLDAYTHTEVDNPTQTVNISFHDAQGARHQVSVSRELFGTILHLSLLCLTFRLTRRVEDFVQMSREDTPRTPSAFLGVARTKRDRDHSCSAFLGVARTKRGRDQFARQHSVHTRCSTKCHLGNSRPATNFLGTPCPTRVRAVSEPQQCQSRADAEADEQYPGREQ